VGCYFVERPTPKLLTDPMPNFEATKVFHHCDCGAEVALQEVESECPECGLEITPKSSTRDLAATMTLGNLPTSPAGGGTLYLEDAVLETDPEEEARLDAQMIGRELGHFKIVDPLGKGGMGQVFRALDTSLRRYVAVKVLRSGMPHAKANTSDHEIEFLLQEAVAQARVTHPNIVTIYYVGKHQEDPFLAMELVNGKTVAELISEGPLPYPELHSVAAQMTDALKFSHELDIIHGDIKPSNILVQENGVAKLSDFGMARRASKTENRSVGGTPRYLAPELMKGEAPSIQSDMYALGATLFEMTFQRLPVSVSGQTVDQWLQCHRYAIELPTPWPEHLAGGWREFLMKLLAKNPADRFDSWRSVDEALERIEPAAAVPARVSPRLAAAAVDFGLVGLLIAPFQYLRTMPEVEAYLSQSALTAAVLLMVEFGAIMAYTALVILWKQSPGRKLMQLRVVNQHGLTVSGQKMGTRSLMRMILMWFFILANISSQDPDGWVRIASTFALSTAGVLTFLDIGTMLISRKGKSLHDLISKTGVVLDT